MTYEEIRNRAKEGKPISPYAMPIEKVIYKMLRHSIARFRAKEISKEELVKDEMLAKGSYESMNKLSEMCVGYAGLNGLFATYERKARDENNQMVIEVCRAYKGVKPEWVQEREQALFQMGKENENA